ncbi:hypothetical protein VTN31DRAFT_4765 [Thermomyces dupontii]|uniref:uncharacterized protein n=1 Tax=Talaromyces thermophilus TaxID=28565 RepID=UPI0037440DD3
MPVHRTILQPTRLSRDRLVISQRPRGGEAGPHNRPTTTTPKGRGISDGIVDAAGEFGECAGSCGRVGIEGVFEGIGVFSGVGIVLVEWAASKGYHLLPLNRLQRLVKGVDVKRAVTEHVPFKASFGATMAMAAFAQF